MLQTIFKPKSSLLRVGIYSLFLGLGSFCLSTGNALALPTQVTLTDTLVASSGIDTCLEMSGSKCKVGTSGDFHVVNQGLPGQDIGDGINERYVGEFDLTSNPADYASFLALNLKSAILDVTISSEYSVGNDGVWLGAVKDSDHEVIGLPEIFYGISSASGGTTLNINLLDHYSKGDILSVITGGTDGNLYVRLGDDHFVNETTLTVTAAQMPEPASFIMLGTGLLGMAAWRYRKSRQQ